jgi:glycosyltransferase involved in cell wall biosynthesis
VRLAIVATHPVQYNAPWFRKLSENADVELRVFYTWHSGQAPVHDAGFGRAIAWDIPLTEGYPFELVAPSSAVERRTFWNMDSPQLIQRLKKFRPDVVLVFGWNYRSHFRVMRHFHGRVPVLFRGDSTLLDQQSSVRAFARTATLRFAYQFVDFALSVGANNRDYFLHHGLRTNQIVHVPHAIDNHRFASVDSGFEQSAQSQRAALGFGEDCTVVLFAGKFELKKCPDRLISAFCRVMEKRPDLRLLLVGSGPLESMLKSTAAGNQGIRFLPFQNQMEIPAIYRVGDVTTLPSSHDETWGLCLNESMASGRPVLASDRVGAARDLVIPGETGFVCQSDEHGLFHALLSLPLRSRLMQMGVNAQRYIADWSFDVIVSRIAELCSSLAYERNAGGAS